MGRPLRRSHGAYHGHASRSQHARGTKRALFDLLALRPVLTAAEHAELAQHIARTLEGLERIAVVLYDEEDKLAARLAALEGLPLRTFSTLEEANGWLMEPGPP